MWTAMPYSSFRRLKLESPIDVVSRAVSHDILSFSARVLNTTASVGALTSFEG